MNFSPLRPEKNSKTRTVRVGIVGAGYISDFHAQAIRNLEGVELVSVCDAKLINANAFAKKWGVPATFHSFNEMIENANLDSVHVLVPANYHYAIGDCALRAGVHVFLEKPMCAAPEEAEKLVALAREKGLLLAVNHNMLFSSAYEKMRDVVKSGEIGALNHVGFDFFQELGQIRFGPFNSWMLRDPGNAILEIGPHIFSAMLDLVGTPDEIQATADRGVKIPGGASVFRRWRVNMSRGRTSIGVHLNLGPGFPTRTISAQGLFGSATTDLDADTFLLDQGTTLSVDLDRYRRTHRLAGQLINQAHKTLGNYLFSKLKFRRLGNPYQTTIIRSVASFYSSLISGKELDSRIEGSFGSSVVAMCERVAKIGIVEKSEPSSISEPASTPPAPKLTGVPNVLVLGGTGFIGVELVRQLLAAGYYVRAMVRAGAGDLGRLTSDHLEIVRGDILSKADLMKAIVGIEFVYHLARADAKAWDEYLEFDVIPTRLVAEACRDAGVKRLIYTGTIDSYYAGGKGDVITEQTPLDKNIKRRNYYARAKAAAESILMRMHYDGLPVVILRPGIVIGRGGNPFHWGVGKWTSGNICQMWGKGEYKLPFVLVSDVASALLRSIEVPGIEGRSYNLIDVPILTSRDYIRELSNISGMKMRAYEGAIWRYYLSDMVKWLVKLAVRHPDRIRIPSYFDWSSRTQRATFDCTKARKELGWNPASDRQKLIEQGIIESLRPWMKSVG